MRRVYIFVPFLSWTSSFAFSLLIYFVLSVQLVEYLTLLCQSVVGAYFIPSLARQVYIDQMNFLSLQCICNMVPKKEGNG